MNNLFLLPVVLLLFTGCNSQPASRELKALETAEVVYKKDTMATMQTAGMDTSYPLTPAEIQDDSVFTDGSEPTSWSNAGFSHPVAFKQFLKRLQYRVANDQTDSVATVIAYPLKHPAIKNKKAFLASYSSLINEKVKNALMHQNLRQIFRRDQGAMIGEEGELWFNETPHGFVIITINNK